MAPFKFGKKHGKDKWESSQGTARSSGTSSSSDGLPPSIQAEKATTGSTIPSSGGTDYSSRIGHVSSSGHSPNIHRAGSLPSSANRSDYYQAHSRGGSYKGPIEKVNRERHHSLATREELDSPWGRVKLSQSPFPRYRHVASSYASDSDEVYVIGGLHDQSVYGDTWIIKSHNNGSYFTSTMVDITETSPPPRVGHAATLCGNAFVIFGGDTHKTNSEGLMDDDVYLFNINSHKWTIPHPVGRRPLGRYGHKISIIATSQVKTRLYVFGGQFDDTYFNDLAVYELSSFRKPGSHWQFVKPVSFVPPPLTNHTMVSYDHKLWVFGGDTPQGLIDEMFMYDPTINDWAVVEATGERPPPLQEHAAVLFKELMCIVGGKDDEDNYSQDVYFFNFKSFRWFKLPRIHHMIPSPRSGHSVTLMPNKKLLIMGGDKFDYARADSSDFSTSDTYTGEGTILYTLDLSRLEEYCPNIFDATKVSPPSRTEATVGPKSSSNTPRTHNSGFSGSSSPQNFGYGNAKSSHVDGIHTPQMGSQHPFQDPSTPTPMPHHISPSKIPHAAQQNQQRPVQSQQFQKQEHSHVQLQSPPPVQKPKSSVPTIDPDLENVKSPKVAGMQLPQQPEAPIERKTSDSLDYDGELGVAILGNSPSKDTIKREQVNVFREQPQTQSSLTKNENSFDSDLPGGFNLDSKNNLGTKASNGVSPRIERYEDSFDSSAEDSLPRVNKISDDTATADSNYKDLSFQNDDSKADLVDSGRSSQSASDNVLNRTPDLSPSSGRISTGKSFGVQKSVNNARPEFGLSKNQSSYTDSPVEKNSAFTERSVPDRKGSATTYNTDISKHTASFEMVPQLLDELNQLKRHAEQSATEASNRIRELESENTKLKQGLQRNGKRTISGAAAEEGAEELQIEYDVLKADNQAYLGRINELEYMLDSKFTDLQKMNEIIQSQSRIIRNSEKMEDYKSKYEELQLAHEAVKKENMALKEQKSSEEAQLNEEVSSYSAKLQELLEIWKSKGSKEMSINGESSSVAGLEQHRAIIDKLKSQLKQTRDENTQLKSLRDELITKQKDFSMLEQNYKSSLNSVNNASKALELSRSELDKLKHENQMLKEQVKDYSLSPSVEGRSKFSGSSFDEPLLPINEAQYNIRIKDLKAELFIITQERDSLKNELLQLKKRMLTMDS
ncbi:HBL275Wp [Eremothecium sinecaudum]|uniref:HBL275Wp n=1 Tax=Eremothecium sinecaudum TaxID=45286 RepID=A0A109UWH9_9SACH|nr:HBL275Wp [Eremothecium sinecaudum]AMD18627.1 HBL275Wp [Eremothecium sinecaudum]